MEKRDPLYPLYRALVKAAKTKTVISYKEASVVLFGAPRPRAMNRPLDKINEYEHAKERPLLAALAVGEHCGFPGKGFFKIAKRLGRLAHNDHIGFWVSERDAVYEAWQTQEDTMSGEKDLRR